MWLHEFVLTWELATCLHSGDEMNTLTYLGDPPATLLTRLGKAQHYLFVYNLENLGGHIRLTDLSG